MNEIFKTTIEWNEATEILKKRYQEEYNALDVQVSYCSQKRTGRYRDEYGFPPEEYTYTETKYTIYFNKIIKDLNFTCSIEKTSDEIKQDLEEELKKIYEDEEYKISYISISDDVVTVNLKKECEKLKKLK